MNSNLGSRFEVYVQNNMSKYQSGNVFYQSSNQIKILTFFYRVCQLKLLEVQILEYL